MPRCDPAIYLTFDDGPHPENTPALLDILAANGIKATFFLIGEQALAHSAIVKRLVDEGHALGNHSMSHPDMRRLGRSAQLAQIDRADVVLADFDGRQHHPFRPPRGHATLTAISRSLRSGPLLALWSFDSFDYRLGFDALIDRLVKYPPRAGEILLFHDDMPATIGAIKYMLPRWHAAGYRFATL